MKSTQSYSFSFYCERGETHLRVSFFFSFLFLLRKRRNTFMLFFFLFFSFPFYCERGEMYLILKVNFKKKNSFLFFSPKKRELNTNLTRQKGS